MSRALTWVIPSRWTSPATTRALKQMLARIETLAAGSKPSMSAVGSNSVYPRRLASARAWSNSMPSVLIRVRMKFVVPLMIPITRVILSPARDSFRGLMIGMPPATAASNEKSTPERSASSNSSLPSVAMSSLLALTTDRPEASAFRIRLLAGSMPPMTSTTTRTSGSSITSCGSLVKRSLAMGTSRSLARLRTATRLIVRWAPERSVISSALAWRMRATAEPTMPQPSRPIPISSPMCPLCPPARLSARRSPGHIILTETHFLRGRDRGQGHDAGLGHRHPRPDRRQPAPPRRAPVPVPAVGEVRIKVSHCGVCRTDLHLAEGDLPPHRPGVVPGHEVVGVVDAVGPGTVLFAPGDRLGIAWLRSTDGTCRFCRSGRENLCCSPAFTGWDTDGGYAEYAVVDERYAYRLPPAVPGEEAAPLLCAGIIGYRALRRAALPPGGRL